MEQRTPTSPDAALVEEIQRGQRAAETALYEKYAARVYYLALSLLRSAASAEDVRNETFLRVLEAIRRDQLRSPPALASFILSTAHNVIREEQRRAPRADQIAEPQGEPNDPRARDLAFQTLEVKQAITEVIRRLKPKERAFLRLYYYEEMEPEEIAKRLGIKAERVRLVKSRTLKRFREVYARLTRRKG